MLRDEIYTALKGAMEARDECRVSTLRLVDAALKNADLEAQGQGKPSLGEDEVLGLLQNFVEQRQELVEIYDRAGRKELADQERGEIDIIRAYLPPQMSEAQAKAAVAEVVAAQAPRASRTWARSWPRSSRATPARWASARHRAWSRACWRAECAGRARALFTIWRGAQRHKEFD